MALVQFWVLYDDQTVKCALILLVLINLPKWSYCDAHYIDDLLLRVEVCDILWKLCSYLSVCLLAVITVGLQWLREVSCECIYWPFLHVSPGDTACMELLSFINWSSCLRAASKKFFLSGITDFWAVVCRFVWCLVFWWSVRETWCYAERFFHLRLIW